MNHAMMFRGTFSFDDGASDDLAADLELGLIQAGDKVLVEASASSWAGHFHPEDRWNGFACPWFPAASVEAIVRYINNRDGQTPVGVVTFDGTTARFPSGWSDDPADEEAWEVYSKASFQIDGQDVWPVGAWAWVWTEARDFSGGIAMIDGVPVTETPTEPIITEPDEAGQRVALVDPLGQWWLMSVDQALAEEQITTDDLVPSVLPYIDGTQPAPVEPEEYVWWFNRGKAAEQRLSTT